MDLNQRKKEVEDEGIFPALSQEVRGGVAPQTCTSVLLRH